jgi:hypothetical protein
MSIMGGLIYEFFHFIVFTVFSVISENIIREPKDANNTERVSTCIENS